MKLTLGIYRVEYGNGVVQFMELISQFDFETIYKPAKDKIADLISDKKGTLADVYKEQVKEANQLKAELKELFTDNFFTDGSPIFKAISTGILDVNGSRNPCKVTKIESPTLILNNVE